MSEFDPTKKWKKFYNSKKLDAYTEFHQNCLEEVTGFETLSVFYKNVPPSKVWKVLYFFVTLHLHLATLKISIHLNVSFLASDQGITYHFLHWHTKLVYLVVAARYVRWHLTFSCWLTISHFKQHCFLFLLISKICPISELFRSASVWIKTCICLNQNIKSFILKFLFSVVHFELVWRVERNSFLHLEQHLSAKCCTHLHCLLLYKSGLTNEPGGGIITQFFIVNRLLGDVEFSDLSRQFYWCPFLKEHWVFEFCVLWKMTSKLSYNRDWHLEELQALQWVQ